MLQHEATGNDNPVSAAISFGRPPAAGWQQLRRRNLILPPTDLPVPIHHCCRDHRHPPARTRPVIAPSPARPVAMAASFWESSQSRCWTFTKEELEQMRDALQEEDQALAQMFPLPDWKHINIFLNMRKAGPSLGP